MRSYIYSAFFTIIWSTVIVAQGNPELLELNVVQGETVVFNLQSDFDSPIVHFTQTKGIVEIEHISNSTYEVSYTPDDNELGMDVFSLKTTHLLGFFPITKLTVVNLNILKSRTQAVDDFISVSGNDPIEINPLDNDITDGLEMTLSITHVMYGEASIVEDNTILYTPSAENLDYINYTAIDETGAARPATIYLKRQEELLDFVFQPFTISNTELQYLFLESDDYIVSSDVIFGSLDQITPRVFKYTPYKDTTGIESIIFIDNNSNIVEVEITTLESAIDNGVLRDDIVYTSVGNEITFNVFANDYDNTLEIVEADEELLHLGNGIFSYEPPSHYRGVKTFTYTATNGFIQEEANIDIVISNFLPSSETTYTFETYESSVLSIPYEIPLDEYYFEIASSPTFGELSYISDNESLITSCGDIINQNVITYIPFDGYEGLDEFDLLYCPDSGLNPCKLIKTSVTVLPNNDNNCDCVENCVWSGDTNNDGLVDVLDILGIGKNLGYSGPSRIYESEWSGVTCEDWDYEDAYGKNSKYSDTNGDGVVTIDDVDNVISNYGKIHSYASNNSLSVKDFPFYLVPQSTDIEVGEIMYIDIILGTESNPVINLEGIAFSMNLSSNIVDSSSVKITYPRNGFFVKQAPFFDFTYQPKDGTIHTAAIKTNGSTSNGHGIIATLEFIVEEELEGVKTPNKTRSAGKSIDIKVSDVTIQDGRGFQHTLNSIETNINIKESIDLSNRDELFYISPNPASTHLKVNLPIGAKSLKLTDIHGRTLISRYLSKSEKEDSAIILNLNNVNSGLHYLSVYSDYDLQTRALQIIK